MSLTRPKATFENFKSIYLAIKKDDPIALEAAIKTSSIDIDQSIPVYDDTYEPVNQCVLFNKNRPVTAKKPSEIAYTMGHVESLSWLLANGADIKPLLEQSFALAQQDTSSLDAHQCRFIDDKTNYMKTAFLSMAYMDKLSPEELETLRSKYVLDSDEEAISAKRPGPGV